ncbi:hypothetical protein COO20_23605 [Thalassospira marina]|uniref:Uncharacterized protein n=1 Tax=Thalassospira marina TaxID=2048283 RepID=A0A2N3KEH0_9PROT|nr:hypothetical protein COO20_23605 [Thalassospira marina]
MQVNASAFSQYGSGSPFGKIGSPWKIGPFLCLAGVVGRVILGLMLWAGRPVACAHKTAGQENCPALR